MAETNLGGFPPCCVFPVSCRVSNNQLASFELIVKWQVFVSSQFLSPLSEVPRPLALRISHNGLAVPQELRFVCARVITHFY